jgi:hypothetical protein
MNDTATSRRVSWYCKPASACRPARSIPSAELIVILHVRGLTNGCVCWEAPRYAFGIVNKGPRAQDYCHRTHRSAQPTHYRPHQPTPAGFHTCGYTGHLFHSTL